VSLLTPNQSRDDFAAAQGRGWDYEGRVIEAISEAETENERLRRELADARAEIQRLNKVIAYGVTR
jgi:hypothetical protein